MGTGAGNINISSQQKFDLTKTVNECELKLKEVKVLIQLALWSNFGTGELSTVLWAAQAEYKCTATVEPDGYQEAYNVMLNHLQGPIKTTKKVHGQWI